MPANGFDYDVGIIGGGPAGSTTASYLSRAGLRCAVFERETFPRPHVGESLVPVTNRILHDLGLLSTMEEAGFVRKYGAVWTTTTTKRSFERAFDSQWVDVTIGGVQLPDRVQNYTYHVDRAKFDHLLLQHCEKLGASVFQGIAVQRVDFQSEGGAEILTSKGGEESRARVRMVVDASGRRTLLGSQLKLRIKDPHFDQFAIHAWFEGYDRGDSTQSDYIFIHFLPMVDTWVWQIPISETVTSIGVVTQRKFFTGTKEMREAFFWDCIATQPRLHEKLREARRVRPFTEEADYSYSMKRLCGDGFVLIGDAARFVDPIFSSGVSIAMTSARFASRSILAAFEAGDLSERSFQDFETIMRRGTATWYKFINLYYRLNLLFTLCLRDPRYRADIIRLLQGEVWDETEPPVLEEMRRVVETVQNDPDHVWHHLLQNSSAAAAM
jgi:FADH2 O2-dependent halogenase